MGKGECRKFSSAPFGVMGPHNTLQDFLYYIKTNTTKESIPGFTKNICREAFIWGQKKKHYSNSPVGQNRQKFKDLIFRKNKKFRSQFYFFCLGKNFNKPKNNCSDPVPCHRRAARTHSGTTSQTSSSAVLWRAGWVR